MKAKRDDTLEEIWAIRRQLAQEFNCDPKKAGEYYRRRHKAAGVKLFRRDDRRLVAK